MQIKFLVDEDFVNYKKPSMFIGAGISCSFKCDKECGQNVCQNSSLSREPTIKLSIEKIVKRYIDNPITSAIVIGGLEPFDNYNEVSNLIKEFRYQTNDDIVIYTGYTKKELGDKIKELSIYPNIIIKFGRFVPNSQARMDEILGVKLASSNQYAEYISRR